MTPLNVYFTTLSSRWASRLYDTRTVQYLTSVCDKRIYTIRSEAPFKPTSDRLERPYAKNTYRAQIHTAFLIKLKQFCRMVALYSRQAYQVHRLHPCGSRSRWNSCFRKYVFGSQFLSSDSCSQIYGFVLSEEFWAFYNTKNINDLQWDIKQSFGSFWATVRVECE